MYLRKETHPFDPNNTKIPVFGMSRLRPETAFTSPFEENRGGVYTLVRFRMEMQVSLGTSGTWRCEFCLQNDQELELRGTEAS